MDSSTLDSLLVAKRLMLLANQQCILGDRHACTAGILILHDALESVLLACLAEKKISVTDKDIAHVEKLTGLVDAHIGSVPNWTKLMGLNRSRGGSKHFGNTVDKHSANDFLYKTQEAINFLVLTTFGKQYHEIYSAELIQHIESKNLLISSAKCLEVAPLEAFRCLADIRKAIFINFEEDFSIEEWQTTDDDEKKNFWKTLCFKRKAPYFTRSKEWIIDNVKNVFDYIQVDYTNLKIELIEYGISVADFFNLLRLTPKVFRHKGKSEWKTEGAFSFLHTERDILEYCLSTAIDAILMKENYKALHKYEPERIEVEVAVTTDTSLYSKACKNSQVVKEIKQGEKFQTYSFTPALTDNLSFVKISEFRKHPKAEFLEGYLLEDHVTPT